MIKEICGRAVYARSTYIVLQKIKIVSTGVQWNLQHAYTSPNETAEIYSQCIKIKKYIDCKHWYITE